MALVCVLLIPSTGAMAKKNPVYISMFGENYTVSSRDEIVLRSNYVACSRGLVNDFFDSVVNHVVINEEYVETTDKKDQSYWSTPIVFGGYTEFCMWDVQNTWISIWEYNLGNLEPGEYNIRLTYDYHFPIIQGFDQYPPFGELEVIEGGGYWQEVTLFVTP